MLVLTRKPGERVIVAKGKNDAPVILEVLRVDGLKVRLGITAPAGQSIAREELINTDTLRKKFGVE